MPTVEVPAWIRQAAPQQGAAKSAPSAPPADAGPADAAPATPPPSNSVAIPDWIKQQAAANAKPKTGAEARASLLGSIGAGIQRGANDIFDWPLEKVAQGAGAAAHAVGLAPNWHPGAATKARAEQYGADYAKNYGDNFPAQAARFGTDVAGTGALLGTGEGAIGAIGDAAAEAMPAETGAMLRSAGKFLAGRSEAGLPARVLSHVAHGALTGAAANNMANGTAGPSWENAGIGALMGGALEPAAAGAGKVLGLANRYVMRPTLGSILDNQPRAAREAAREIMDKMAADRTPPQDVLARLREMGPNATLADAGGEAIKQHAEGLANNGGLSAQYARAVLEDRANGAEGRVTQAIHQATGQSGNVYDTREGLLAARSAAARPKFQAAFERIKPTPEELEKLNPIIESKWGQQGIAKALNTAHMNALANGDVFNPADLGFVRAADGSGAWAVAPDAKSLPALHAVKEGLDDLIEDQRDPVTGRLPKTKEAIARANLRDNFRDQLKAMYPRYKDALDAWSGPSQSIDAQNMGSRVLKNDPDVTASIVDRMSPNDKAFFLNGVARSLLDKIEGNAESASDALAVFGRASVRKKIEAALPPGESYAKFEHDMRNEIEFAANKNRFIRGSQTAQREALKAGLMNYLPHIARAVSGDIPGAAMGAARDTFLRGLSPSENLDLARGQLMFTPGAADDIENALRKARPGLFARSANVAKRAGARALIPAAVTAGNRISGQ